MRTHAVSPSAPLELLRLRTATAVYLDTLRDVDTWAKQAVDVNRIVNPLWAGRLAGLRDELRVALRSTEQGTPARINQVVSELLGGKP